MTSDPRSRLRLPSWEDRLRPGGDLVTRRVEGPLTWTIHVASQPLPEGSQQKEVVMYQGRTLTELAAELERQASTKRDLIVPAARMEMDLVGQDPVLAIQSNGDREVFPVRPIAHAQIAQHLGVPKRYYDRCLEERPDILVAQVNGWLGEEVEAGTTRMIRTLDGNVRAYLSDRYRPLDNFDLAEVVLPALTVIPGLQVSSCEVTERRMYIKAITKEIGFEIDRSTTFRHDGHRGDIVHPGITISNSEVGAGKIKIEPTLHWPVCLNIAICTSYALSKLHLGASTKAGEDVSVFFQDSTRKKADEAFWLQVKDTISGTMSTDGFEKIIASVRATTERKIEGRLDEVVEVVSEKFSFTEGEKDGVLKHLIEGGDLSQYGLTNAITRASQDADNYDRATELERIGGDVIELAKTDWERLAA